MRRLLALTIGVAVISGDANAQAADDWSSWPLAERFYVSVEGFFPRLDTKVRVDATDGTPGTVIDFEQNLGMSETETLPAFGFAWRFARKHRLRLDYFSLKRSGSAISTTEIRFGDEVFQVDLPISSFFDIDVYSFGYSYSPIFDRKKEIALFAGVSVQDVGFGLQGNEAVGIISNSSGITAPLPAFGAGGGYAFTDKLTGRLGIGYFSFNLALSDEDKISGEITNANLGIFHETFENFRFGLKYSYFNVDAEFGNPSGFNVIEYNYHGPSLAVEVIF